MKKEDMGIREYIDSIKVFGEPKTGDLSDSDPSAGSIRQAKEEAVSAIYFDDSSDYRSALLNVVKHLDPELYDLMLIDRKAAFKKVSE